MTIVNTRSAERHLRPSVKLVNYLLTNIDRKHAFSRKAFATYTPPGYRDRLPNRKHAFSRKAFATCRQGYHIPSLRIPIVNTRSAERHLRLESFVDCYGNSAVNRKHAFSRKVFATTMLHRPYSTFASDRKHAFSRKAFATPTPAPECTRNRPIVNTHSAERHLRLEIYHISIRLRV